MQVCSFCARFHVIIFAGELRLEDWLTNYETAQVSGYNPDYIRQLIRAEKVQGRKWDCPLYLFLAVPKSSSCSETRQYFRYADILLGCSKDI
jgi:hypothetical protein